MIFEKKCLIKAHTILHQRQSRQNRIHIPYHKILTEYLRQRSDSLPINGVTKTIQIREKNQKGLSNNSKINQCSQRVLVHHSNDPNNKQQSQLTAQQRKVVRDISRLFNTEPSKPTKLLIRLNQTQCNKSSESRLQKIEVMRLDLQKQANILDILKQPTAVSINEEHPSKTQDEQESSSFTSSIGIQGRLQNFRQRLSASKQISMMFVPQLNLSTILGMKNPPQIFSKFNRKATIKGVLDSNGSNCSQILMDKNQQKQESLVFCRLMDIDLFMKRNEVQAHRMEELRQANQKMLSSHLIDKENTQKSKQALKSKQKLFTQKLEQLTKQTQLLKAANTQLTKIIEAKQKALSNSNNLNEQYIKQKNELKANIQIYLKTIHILKLQMTNKQSQQQQEKTDFKADQSINMGNRRNIITKDNFQNQRSVNQLKKYVSPQIQRRQITFNKINHQTPSANNILHSFNPYYTAEMNQIMRVQYSKQQKDKQPAELKLTSYRSQQKAVGVIQNEDEIKNRVEFLSSRSQKTLIRKNTVKQEQIPTSNRNLVKVNKNIQKQASILGEQLRDNKSSCSISNLSGKSISQRIGFISKVAQVDKSKGMLVDYMIEKPTASKVETAPKKAERFIFRAKLQ